MRFLILLSLLPLTACIELDYKCDGTVITLNPSWTTYEDDTVVSTTCYSPTSNGYDYSECCPDGYDFIGLTENNLMLCEEVCDPDENAVAQAEDAAFIMHGLVGQYLESVEELHSAGPL